MACITAGSALVKVAHLNVTIGRLYYCIDRLAMTAVKALPSSITATVLKQSLWSEAEEQILAGIPSVCVHFSRSVYYICSRQKMLT